MEILLKKYESLIRVKLKKFDVNRNDYSDYLQDLALVIYKAIINFDEASGKSLCRYLELIIERRLLRVLKYKYRESNTIFIADDVQQFSHKEDVLQEMVYEERLKEINRVKLDDFKRAILNEVFIDGDSIKDFSKKYNTSSKEVYNHIYMLRCKLKEKP